MLILASLPGIMLELKYGYDVFYDVRIRAIASFLSVLSVPAYALVWTIFFTSLLYDTSKIPAYLLSDNAVPIHNFHHLANRYT